jgi:hypothetical protein
MLPSSKPIPNPSQRPNQPSLNRQTGANFIFIADLRSPCLDLRQRQHQHQHQHQCPRPRPRPRSHSASTTGTAESPAAALIEAFDPEVLAQVPGTHGGLGGIGGGAVFRLFSPGGRSAAKIGAEYSVYERDESC